MAMKENPYMMLAKFILPSHQTNCNKSYKIM